MAWNKLDGVKALVDTGIRSVPAVYVKPVEQRRSEDEGELHELDTVDLSEEDGLIISKLKQASQTLGFFEVVNHGVDLKLMDQMTELAHKFFDLPLEEKMKLYSTDFSSPVRYGTSFNPFSEKLLDWSDHVLHRFMVKDKSVPHPWPEQPPNYRDSAKEYVNQMETLAARLTRYLSLGLGVDPEYLEKAVGELEPAFRLNYYPPCPEPDLVLGLSSHSDVGLLTILLQDVPGLQVKVHGQWKTMKPKPGVLVVNICDQLEILSNGIYRSVEHRAVPNSDVARVSVAYFTNPESDVEIGPLPQLVDDDHPAQYRPCTFEDYVKKLLSTKLSGKDWVNSQKV